jgi:hypothetical protein
MLVSRVAPARLGDRLGALRDRFFVGRAAELALFQAALQDRNLALLFVHGPAGVGNSVLLREFGRQATRARATVVALAGRDLEPSPAGLQKALRGVLELQPNAEPTEALAGEHQRPVLLLDTYEQLTPLDTWLRQVFLPSLPDPRPGGPGRTKPTLASLARRRRLERAHARHPPAQSRAE